MKYNHLDLAKLYKYVRADLFKGELPLVLTHATTLIYEKEIYKLMYSIPALFTPLQQNAFKKENFIKKMIPTFNKVWNNQIMIEMDTKEFLKNLPNMKNGDVAMFEHSKTKVIFSAPIIDKDNYLAFSTNGSTVDIRELNIVAYGKHVSHFDVLTSEEIDDIIKHGIFNANIKWGKI